MYIIYTVFLNECELDFRRSWFQILVSSNSSHESIEEGVVEIVSKIIF